jgi:hypothetical protein
MRTILNNGHTPVDAEPPLSFDSISLFSTPLLQPFDKREAWVNKNRHSYAE